MSLCENILEIIHQQATQHDFTKVIKVGLEVGMLSGVEPEAMRFCFDVVSQGTLAQDATLDIFTPPAPAFCINCEKTIEVNSAQDTCPSCGSHWISVRGGDKLRIRDLEVE